MAMSRNSRRTWPAGRHKPRVLINLGHACLSMHGQMSTNSGTVTVRGRSAITQQRRDHDRSVDRHQRRTGRVSRNDTPRPPRMREDRWQYGTGKIGSATEHSCPLYNPARTMRHFRPASTLTMTLPSIISSPCCVPTAMRVDFPLRAGTLFMSWL